MERMGTEPMGKQRLGSNGSVTNNKQEAAMAAKKKTEPKDLELPDIKIATIKLRLSGDTLIVNNFGEKSKEQMRQAQQQKARNKKEAKDPVACFESAKYLDSNGNDCIPAQGIKLALVSAARFTEGLAMTLLKQAVFVKGDLVPLKYKKCAMREDVVRVGNFPNKTADLRYRPEYTGWSLECDVEFNANVLQPDHIVTLARIAGFHIGLCEWRPEKGGQYGRFEVAVASGRLKRVA